jgi:hypothetical protein
VKAGRELDARVAETLFGCNVMYMGELPLCRCEKPRFAHSVDPVRGQVRAYSTEIGAAWLVVEFLRARYDVTVASEGSGWACTLAARGGGDSHSEMAPSAALAICLAGLKTV